MAERDDPSLDAAYGLETPEDSVRLYGQWADTYDQGFAAAQSYDLPRAVAARFAALGGQGPVLDLGAGTGLVAEHLRDLGVGPIDGTDISPEMLAVAAQKNLYHALFEGNILTRLPCPDGSYAGCVSAGTFTLGHVGPAGVEEVLRVLAPGGRACLSVNRAHYEAAEFASALTRPDIAALDLTEVAIYSDPSDPSHGADTAFLVSFLRV